MGRTWHKPHYVKSDHDPTTRDLRPGAIAPGLYCEDEATLDQILKDPSVGKVERAYAAKIEDVRPRAWPPITISGIRVRVATEAELVVLRGVKAGPPAKPEPNPLAGVVAVMKPLLDRMEAEVLASWRGSHRGIRVWFRQARSYDQVAPTAKGRSLLRDLAEVNPDWQDRSVA